jgi:3-deoxy-D-arabino-heptulosonate 7-phosphate (DAHP) synthase
MSESRSQPGRRVSWGSCESRTASVLTIRFESNLKGGKQSSEQPRENLEYGVSITDGELLG